MLIPAAPTTALIEINASHAQQRRELGNTVISATPTRELAMPHKQVPRSTAATKWGTSDPLVADGVTGDLPCP
jgi:hypothetical protein